MKPFPKRIFICFVNLQVSMRKSFEKKVKQYVTSFCQSPQLRVRELASLWQFPFDLSSKFARFPWTSSPSPGRRARETLRSPSSHTPHTTRLDLSKKGENVLYSHTNCALKQNMLLGSNFDFKARNLSLSSEKYAAESSSGLFSGAYTPNCDSRGQACLILRQKTFAFSRLSDWTSSSVVD